MDSHVIVMLGITAGGLFFVFMAYREKRRDDSDSKEEAAKIATTKSKTNL